MRNAISHSPGAPIITDSSGNPASNVVVADTELDIQTYDNQSQTVACVATFNFATANAMPVGCTKALVNYYQVGGAATDVCYIRWGAAANATTCMRLQHGDSFILSVPTTGTRKLNVFTPTGATAGSAVYITPLG